MGTSAPTMGAKNIIVPYPTHDQTGPRMEADRWLSVLQDCSTGEGGRDSVVLRLGQGRGASASPEGSGPLLGGDLPL